MPTWINHFRIADKLLDKITVLDVRCFLIGTIAPDCGLPDKEHGIYKPYTGVTHFTSELEYSKKTDCNYDLVYERYIRDETDVKKKSFYIAYFIHLITDCIFARELFAPIESEAGDFRFNTALCNQVRRERNNSDFYYLKNNVSPSYELFKNCEPWSENYPEWYTHNEIAVQMQNIVNYYENAEYVSMEYEYISPDLMGKFVDYAYRVVLDEINKRKIEL